MADFISKLQINAFRGVKDLALDNLSTVNVLVVPTTAARPAYWKQFPF